MKNKMEWLKDYVQRLEAEATKAQEEDHNSTTMTTYARYMYKDGMHQAARVILEMMEMYEELEGQETKRR